MHLKRLTRSGLLVIMCLLLAVSGFWAAPVEEAFASSNSKTGEDKDDDDDEEDDDDKSLEEIRKDLKNAQSELDGLKASLNNAKTAVSNLKNSKADVESKIAALEAQIKDVQGTIDGLNSQMEATAALIATTTAALEEAEATRAQQYESMKLRMQFMYENSSALYMEALFGSGGISEMLNAIEYITDLSRYDREKLTEYEETEAQIEATKVLLEEEYASLEDAKAVQQENMKTLEALESQREKELVSIGKDLVSAEEQQKAWEAEVKAQEEVIAAIRAAEAEKAGKENGSLIDSRYGFLWPCDSTRITSNYGYRESPIAGAGTNHKGIDIGAPYGSNIYATQSGRVIIARYSNSAGNWVTIDHGEGLYSVYMHASSLCVSEGQSVNRGDVIARVGSTGQSTGNHLHFGVSLNGSYVSPWGYVSIP